MTRPLATTEARRREDALIARAARVLRRRAAETRSRYRVSSPGTLGKYLTLELGTRGREAFWAVFFDRQNRVLAMDEISRGTLTQCVVHPREVVRAALLHNAAAVAVAHNHPSGDARFSAADLRLTEELKSALRLVDVELLDHLVVAGDRVVSLAQLEADRGAARPSHAKASV